jgi:hypothetical protein
MQTVSPQHHFPFYIPSHKYPVLVKDIAFPVLVGNFRSMRLAENHVAFFVSPPCTLSVFSSHLERVLSLDLGTSNWDGALVVVGERADDAVEGVADVKRDREVDGEEVAYLARDEEPPIASSLTT